MYNVLQEFYNALDFVFMTVFGSGSALLLLPLFLPLFSLMMRLVKSLCMGRTMRIKKAEIKHSSSGSDWQEQYDKLIYEHDNSCQNVKAILEENKR